VTAIIGSLTANVDGRRLAGAHLIFNAVTAAVAIGFIYQLTGIVDVISGWMGIANDNYAMKLAVFHSIFNGLGIVLMLPMINPMVRFLQRVIKQRVRTAAEPRFLNSANISLPDTAIEAVRMETLRLFDNASEIIAEGLSLSLPEILSDRPLDEIVAHARKSVSFDIDERYDLNVKELYGKIVEFISNAQSTMSPSQVDELFALRAAGRDIVEAIKDTKHLQKNLSHYFTSDNEAIRQEYDHIRANLANALRQLDNVRQQDDDASTSLSLDSIKIGMKQHDRDLNARLSTLIRDHLITAPMSISLMNDSGYAYHVTKNLVKMGDVLFSNSESQLREAERSVSLDEAELEELLQKTKNPTSEHNDETK